MPDPMLYDEVQAAKMINPKWAKLKHPELKIRKLIHQLGAPHRKDGATILLTRNDIETLVEMMKCPSNLLKSNGQQTGICVVPSADKTYMKVRELLSEK
ncbi:MAG: hypothetical protein ACFB15_18920 [Cyclobacteriaceae bacterium]